MTMTVFVLAIVAWLAVQIPIGMAVGWYIRRASTLMPAEPVRAKSYARRARRPLAGPPALLRG